jgi:Ca-activated chloride channel family protein
MRMPGPHRGRRLVNPTLLPSLLLIALTGLAEPQPSREDNAPEAYRISVDVDLVVLYAAVRDRHGQAVANLRQQDFEVYEDGVRQSIRLFRHEDVPVTVGVVVDHSGSMRQKLTHVVAAARTFVHSRNRDDQMFIVNFNENVTLGLPDSIPFTNSAHELSKAISDTPAEGMTALYDAIVRAQRLVQKSNHDKNVLIVISDGGDNASTHTLAEVLKIGEQSSALVYAVGVFDEDDPDRNPGVLRRLARETGGEAYFPGRAEEVVSICERIARDIRQQYIIGYVPKNAAKGGGYRVVRLIGRANGSKLVVRTRSGYTPAIAEQSIKDKDSR